MTKESVVFSRKKIEGFNKEIEMSKLDYKKTINAKQKERRDELIKTFMAQVLPSFISIGYEKDWTKKEIAIAAQLQAEIAADAYLERI